MNILITGGASGLGEAITRSLAKDQDNLIYFTYSMSKPNAEKIEDEFKNTLAIKCNYNVGTELESLLKRIEEFDLDILINNAYAGEFIHTYFHQIPADVFFNDFKENIIPTIEITQKAIAFFRKKKRGKIITILTAGLLNVPPIGSAVYIANKAYLEKLTKVWASENSKFNITSNSVSPSFMKTKLADKIDERVIEQIIDNHPLKKLLKVDEVAESVHYLVYASPQINGVDIVINSGVNLK